LKSFNCLPLLIGYDHYYNKNYELESGFAFLSWLLVIIFILRKLFKIIPDPYNIYRLLEKKEEPIVFNQSCFICIENKVELIKKLEKLGIYNINSMPLDLSKKYIEVNNDQYRLTDKPNMNNTNCHRSEVAFLYLIINRSNFSKKLKKEYLKSVSNDLENKRINR
jgi:hypothetical protein